MKICIDARTFFFRGGVGVYTRNLLPAMAAAAPEHEFVALISSRHTIADIPFSFPNLKAQVSSAEWEDNNGMQAFAEEADNTGSDACFMPFCLTPVTMKNPLIIILHDVIPAAHPEYFTKELAAKFSSENISGALNSASRIVCDSRCTMRDAAKLFNTHEEKMSVAYPGVSESFRPYTREEAVPIISKYALTYHEFILFTGVVEPRKNVGGLIRAFEGSATLRDRGLKLVIAGKKGWKVDHIYDYVQNSGLQDRVIFLDYTPDEDLRALMGSCALFVYPSFYEGFGLPVLEAMASGAPVVASNSSSIPEITGDAAVLVNPESVDEIRAAMEKVLSDDGFSAALRSGGIQRAKYFSWKRTAEAINAIISNLGGG